MESYKCVVYDEKNKRKIINFEKAFVSLKDSVIELPACIPFDICFITGFSFLFACFSNTWNNPVISLPDSSNIPISLHKIFKSLLLNFFLY